MDHWLWQPCRNGLALAWWKWSTGPGLAKLRLLSELLWQTSVEAWGLKYTQTLKCTSTRMQGCTYPHKGCAIHHPVVTREIIQSFPSGLFLHILFLRVFPENPTHSPIPQFRPLNNLILRGAFFKPFVYILKIYPPWRPVYGSRAPPYRSAGQHIFLNASESYYCIKNCNEANRGPLGKESRCPCSGCDHIQWRGAASRAVSDKVANLHQNGLFYNAHFRRGDYKAYNTHQNCLYIRNPCAPNVSTLSNGWFFLA